MTSVAFAKLMQTSLVTTIRFRSLIFIHASARAARLSLFLPSERLSFLVLSSCKRSCRKHNTNKKALLLSSGASPIILPSSISKISLSSFLTFRSRFSELLSTNFGLGTCLTQFTAAARDLNCLFCIRKNKKKVIFNVSVLHHIFVQRLPWNSERLVEYVAFSF